MAKILFDEYGIRTASYNITDLSIALGEMQSKQYRACKNNIYIANSEMIKRQQRINILKSEIERLCESKS